MSELSDLIRLSPEEVYSQEVDLSELVEPICKICGSVIPNFGKFFQPKTCEMCNNAWTVGFPSDFVTVGFNSENADMDNPDGAIIQERFSVVAEDALGHRRVWGGLYESPEAAEAAYSLLAPIIALWEEIRPAYGSEAYAANWKEHQADDIARERAAEVNEWMGDCVDFDMYEGPDL